VYVAIRAGFKAMRRQLQDYVCCLRRDVKTHHPAPHAKVGKLFPREGYGFIETPDGREIYFHKNSVLNSSFEHLDIGDEVIWQNIGETEDTCLGMVGTRSHKHIPNYCALRPVVLRFAGDAITKLD
jgi:cold shock CspA family protein